MKNETAVVGRRGRERNHAKGEERERCGKGGRMVIIPSMHAQLICYPSRTRMSLPSASSSLP